MPREPLPAATTVSVVIPVRNGGADFTRLLSGLAAQQGLQDLEIVVVDSGSSDGSLDAAREHGARIIRIPPEEFSHSQSRNLGARHARGASLLFMVQDALPPSDRWLSEIVDAMQAAGVSALSCAESPRDDADLFYRVSTWFHDRFMEIEGRDRIMFRPAGDDYRSVRKNAQLSNICCLIPRSLFLQYGFRGDFGEDLELGIRLIRDGHRLALLGTKRIVHSHTRPPYYQLKRGYVDVRLLLHLFPDFSVPLIEVEDLLPDIVATFGVVDATMQGELASLPTPCDPAALSDAVRAGLRHHAAGGAAVDRCIDSDLADPDFIAFLRSVDGRCARHGAGPVLDAALFKGVSDGLGGVLEYLTDTGAVVDAALLEDFKACAYKTHAIQSGVHLASAFARGSAMTKDKLRPIHAELTRGI